MNSTVTLAEVQLLIGTLHHMAVILPSRFMPSQFKVIDTPHAIDQKDFYFSFACFVSGVCASFFEKIDLPVKLPQLACISFPIKPNDPVRLRPERGRPQHAFAFVDRFR